MKIPKKRGTQQVASNYSSDIDFKRFMKLYIYYTKEPYSFLVHDTTLSSINNFDLGKTYYRKSKELYQNQAKQS